MKFVDLFAGAGGMSCGLDQAGLEPLAGFDIEASAVQVYSANLWVDHGRLRNLSDFAKVLPDVLRLAPDLIVGGPPCQDFSAAKAPSADPKKRISEGERSDRTRDFAYAVCLSKAEWFVFENTPRAPKSRAYQDARSVWKAHGYGLTEVMLNAARYGVPQSRKRFFCIGRLGEIDGFLEQDIVAAATDKDLSLKEHFGDRIKDAIYVHPRNTQRRRLWSTAEPAPTVRATYKVANPQEYEPHPNDAPGETTMLTTQMVSEIQGFPPTWRWRIRGIKPKEINQMIANACPPPMAKVIGKCILDRHEVRTLPPIRSGFEEALLTGFGGRKPIGEASVKNVVARLKRASKLLGGKIYADINASLAALENPNNAAFNALDARQQSDLRSALRAYDEYVQLTQSDYPSIYTTDYDPLAPDEAWSRMRHWRHHWRAHPTGYVSKRIRHGNDVYRLDGRVSLNSIRTSPQDDEDPYFDPEWERELEARYPSTDGDDEADDDQTDDLIEDDQDDD